MATTTTDAGYNSQYKLMNMFDNDPKTLWHSGSNFVDKHKTVTVDFVVSKLIISKEIFCCD